MDLQAAEMLSGKRWSLTKVTALVCFALACGLLIGSLLTPAKAEAGPVPDASLGLVSSSRAV